MATSKKAFSNFKNGMLEQFAAYRAARFAGQDHLFDPDPKHHYIFKHEYRSHNLFDQSLMDLIEGKENRFLGDMGSSQTLTLSVFGTMAKRGGLPLLATVPDDEGFPILPLFELQGEPAFEYSVPTKAFCEPSPTQVDLLIPKAGGQIAVECKLWEDKFGACSQVGRKKGECNGKYELQAGDSSGQRCVLAGKGIQYWSHFPELFDWDTESDISPCPLREPYQLVRNILAAAVNPESKQIFQAPTAVLIFDERNPAFAPRGSADAQYRIVQATLHESTMLARTTWQFLAQVLKERGGYEDLLQWLEEKYGILPVFWRPAYQRDPVAC